MITFRYCYPLCFSQFPRALSNVGEFVLFCFWWPNQPIRLLNFYMPFGKHYIYLTNMPDRCKICRLTMKGNFVTIVLPGKRLKFGNASCHYFFGPFRKQMCAHQRNVSGWCLVVITWDVQLLIGKISAKGARSDGWASSQRSAYGGQLTKWKAE